MIGKDPFIGDNTAYKLSDSLIQNLNKNGIYSLAQADVPNIVDNSQHWINSNLLNLSEDLIGMGKFYYRFKKKHNYT
jgi:hypothetical protein